MNISKFTKFALVLAIAALIMRFSTYAQMTSQMKGLGGEISIGVVLPLTGALAAPYGLPMQRGFELAREEISKLRSTQR